jgi:hypothetical protein
VIIDIAFIIDNGILDYWFPEKDPMDFEPLEWFGNST